MQLVSSHTKKKKKHESTSLNQTATRKRETELLRETELSSAQTEGLI